MLYQTGATQTDLNELRAEATDLLLLMGRVRVTADRMESRHTIDRLTQADLEATANQDLAQVLDPEAPGGFRLDVSQAQAVLGGALTAAETMYQALHAERTDPSGDPLPTLYDLVAEIVR